MHADAVLTCRDCAAQFAFSDDERRLFASQGHIHPPSRCSECRLARKERQADSGIRVVGPGFREHKEVRTVVHCSTCGAEAEVPFVPRSDRAVYCRVCFHERRREATDS